MTLQLAAVLVLAAAVMGAFVGFGHAAFVYSTLDQPPDPPGRVERMRIRHRRRQEFARRRAEFVRTGALLPPRINRMETW